MSFAKFKAKFRAAPRRGFTLMEVLIAVAITGLVVAGGFRLISMSLRSLSEVRGERQLTAAAQRIWLRFRTEHDMPDSGQEDYNPDTVAQDTLDVNAHYKLEWRVDLDSVPIEELELKFKRVTVTLTDAEGVARSMVIYLPQ